jgi:hypothetical protein
VMDLELEVELLTSIDIVLLINEFDVLVEL